MNGLCAGLGAIGAFIFALIAATNGEYLVAITGFLMCGALVGFLPWNFPNARAFLGDAGSHLVGYLLAVMAILPHFYTKQNPRPLAVLAPLFVLAIPLLDLAQVSLFRTLNKKPFWIGDTNHLSHRLVARGFEPHPRRAAALAHCRHHRCRCVLALTGRVRRAATTPPVIAGGTRSHLPYFCHKFRPTTFDSAA